MPHGGYHGVIKMGGRVIQDSSGRPPRSSRTSNKTSQDLIKEIKDKRAAATDDFGGSREAFIATQSDVARLSDTLRREQEKNLADQVRQSFAQGNVRKSDFTGDAGDKSFFGINYGSTPTAAATVINPFTGERIVTRKVREGMTSPEYANYMRDLYSLNPTLMEQTFPVASGAAVRNLARFAPGLGTLSTIASFFGDKSDQLLGGIKKIAQDKGIIPKDSINPATGTTADTTSKDVISPSAASRVDPITFDSIFTGDTPMDPRPAVAPGTSFDPSAGRYSTGIGADDKVAQAYMDKAATFQSPRFTGRTPTDPDPVQRALPTDAITQGIQSLFTGATPQDPRPVREQFSSTFQQPFNPPMIPGGIPRGSLPVREGRLLGQDPNIAYGQELSLLDIIADNLNTRGFQEGGLASINNPQYNMLMKASDFDI
jgi:hypothetical protein